MEKVEYRKMYKLENQHFWFLGKRMFVEASLEPYKEKISKILDVGCGTGGMTKYLERYGKVIGIEKEAYPLKFAKRRDIKVLRGDAQGIPFPEDSFDLVTLFDVLYHKEISNIRKALRESRRVLRSSGFLLITDSALPFLKSQHDVSLHSRRRFYLSEMFRLVESGGFTVLRSSYIYFSLFPLVLIKRLVLNRFGNKWGSDVGRVHPTLNKIALFILKIEAGLLKKISYPFGSSILVLAQKK